MSIPDLQERLAAMDDSWNDAVAPAGIEMPPDGDYQALVERFDFFEAKKEPCHVFLKTELSVTSSDYQGWPASTLHDLEDPERLGWLKKHLSALGLEVEPFSTLEQRLAEAVGIPVEITIKTKGDYRNVYCNKRLGDPGASASPGKASKADDEIPF